MRYTQEQAAILHIEEIAPGVYNTVLSAKTIASASAGQFVQVLCEPYQLRRPISIAGFDPALGILRLIFEVRGKGTAWLAQRQKGDSLDLIGPLGHGFPLTDASKKAVLVGGGIGTPPLLPPAQFHGANATVITGFRTRSCRRISPRPGLRRSSVPTMGRRASTALPPRRSNSGFRRETWGWCIPAAPRS